MIVGAQIQSLNHFTVSATGFNFKVFVEPVAIAVGVTVIRCARNGVRVFTGGGVVLPLPPPPQPASAKRINE